MKTIYLAGGCFWGTEHYIKQFDGVIKTTVGYANGNIQNPSYEQVYTDETGYAECVKVVIDENTLPLKTLLKLFFISIDPLQKDGQGGDIGTRYRTGIYWTDHDDRQTVEDVYAEIQSTYEAELTDAVHSNGCLAQQNIISVETGPLKCFYPAEDYHQDYLVKHPDGYCHISIATQHFAKTYARLTEALKTVQAPSSELSKEEKYSILSEYISLLVKSKDDTIKSLAQISLMIHQTFGFWWTGFYLVKGKELILGPYQGPLACLRIAYGRGVCGTAWKEGRTIIVPDVEEFPGHIACSSESRSEIVIPLRHEGEIKGVLDIDSEKLATFDDTDALWLEKIIADLNLV